MLRYILTRRLGRADTSLRHRGAAGLGLCHYGLHASSWRCDRLEFNSTTDERDILS
jgi:hypothetical protein